MKDRSRFYRGQKNRNDFRLRDPHNPATHIDGVANVQVWQTKASKLIVKCVPASVLRPLERNGSEVENRFEKKFDQANHDDCERLCVKLNRTA